MAHDDKSLSAESLVALKESLEAVQGALGEMPHTGLVKLANLDVSADLTVDFTTRESLGFPLVVMRPNGSSPLLKVLSPREIEVVSLASSGLANKEIAAKLGIQVGTVKDHIHRILEKTGCPNRAALATAFAERQPH